MPSQRAPSPPQLRIDPLTRRHALIAEERAGRPNDFVAPTTNRPRHLPQSRTGRSEHCPECPFCAGNESATPEQITVVPAPPLAWSTRVIPNKFPAMALRDARAARKKLPKVHAASAGAAVGAHEVVVESARHVSDWVELTPREMAIALAVHVERLRYWANEGRLAHGLIFKNCGAAAGASLEHVHSQLVATPYVLPDVAEELAGAQRLATRSAPCWFCAELASQRSGGDRGVAFEGDWAAICPPAPRQPFETWILPTRHEASFHNADPDLIAGSAGLLQRLIRTTQRHAGADDYNLVLHSAPFALDCASSYHWHWELIPRVNHLAGLELGAGVFINSVSPETAAATLRNDLAR